MYSTAYAPAMTSTYVAPRSTLDMLVGSAYTTVAASREAGTDVRQNYRGSDGGGKESSHASYDHAMGHDEREALRLNLSNVAREYHFVAADFLTGLPTRAINRREELMPLVEEAFEKRTGTPFPDDILITLCTPVELEKAFGPGFTPDVQGFCRNRRGRGVSEVFVRRGELGHVMLTLGHEIGHALSPTLPDARDEEAKAFAFALAWMETIREHNIGGLKVAIAPNPARNGLHNVAFDFVVAAARQGTAMLDIFGALAKGALTITKRPESIMLT